MMLVFKKFMFTQGVRKHRVPLIGVFGALVVVISGACLYHLIQTTQLLHLYETDRFNIASMYYERGNYYFGGGAYDIEKALGNFEMALQYENKARDPIRYQIGRIHFIKGDLKRAIEEFDKQLAENPEFKQTYYMRGLTYGYLGEFDKGEADFKEYIARNPKSWAGHNDLVWIYFLQGKYESAEQYARQGLAVAPNNPWLANSLGAILLNQERYEEAITYLTVARSGFGALSPDEWGRAYPGNDPRIYDEGLRASLGSAEENLQKAETQLRGIEGV